ncbi:MAG: AI-2E family transporter [Clostridia bacterium]|nr:AI-2E family transporter [Clostridia bacterium]
MKNEKKFWVIVALVFVAILVWHITSALVPALANGVKALTPFLLAFITAYLLKYPVVWVEKLLWLISKKKEHKWQHAVAGIFVLFVFFGLVVLIIGLLLPGIITNLNNLINTLPSFIEKVITLFKGTVDELSETVDTETRARLLDIISNLGNQALTKVTQAAGNMVGTVTDLASRTAGFLMDLVLYLVASFLLLLGYDDIKRSFKRVLKVFIKNDEKYEDACEFLHDSDDIVEKYIVVRLSTSLGIGVISYIGFLLFGLNYALLLAVVVAITNLVPYIGPFVGAVPAVIVALAMGNPAIAFWVAVFLFVLQQIEGNVLTPWITSDALNVSPILVLVGIAVFGAMMGIPGMILGAPIVAIISGMFKSAINIRENKAKKEKNDEIQ